MSTRRHRALDPDDRHDWTFVQTKIGHQDDPLGHWTCSRCNSVVGFPFNHSGQAPRPTHMVNGPGRRGGWSCKDVQVSLVMKT